jgi:thymidylate synthase (methanogen type)
LQIPTIAESLIIANNIVEAWMKILHMIMHYGIVFWDEKGNQTKEVLNLFIIIKNPLDRAYMLTSNINKDQAEIFTTFLTNEASAISSGFIPGQRLYNFLGENQWKKIIKKLREQEKTRRASIVTCNPYKDWDSDRPPCLMMLDFKVRGIDNYKKLNLTAVLRSNDMFRTWPVNAYTLAKLIKKACNEVGNGVQPGILAMLSISAHIYSDNFNDAEKILKQYKIDDSYTLTQEKPTQPY